jgi:hypothetical protein
MNVISENELLKIECCGSYDVDDATKFILFKGLGKEFGHWLLAKQKVNKEKKKRK